MAITKLILRSATLSVVFIAGVLSSALIPAQNAHAFGLNIYRAPLTDGPDCPPTWRTYFYAHLASMSAADIQQYLNNTPPSCMALRAEEASYYASRTAPAPTTNANSPPVQFTPGQLQNLRLPPGPPIKNPPTLTPHGN